MSQQQEAETNMAEPEAGICGSPFRWTVPDKVGGELTGQSKLSLDSHFGARCWWVTRWLKGALIIIFSVAVGSLLDKMKASQPVISISGSVRVFFFFRNVWTR